MTHRKQEELPGKGTMRKLRDILENRADIDDDNPEIIDLRGAYHLEISRSRVALIRMVSKPSKEDPAAVEPRLVCDFLPWYPEVANRATVGRDGKITETKTALFRPEVIRRDRTYRLPYPLTDLKTVYQMSALAPMFHRAGLQLPLDPTDRTVLGNLLSSLGVDDGSRESGIEVEAMGWGEIDGAWTYMAPSGSVTAEGIVNVRVSAPGSEGEEDALPEVLGEIGFDRTLEGRELRKAADAIGSFIGICRDDHPMPYLLLGTLFTAPLPQPEQTTLNVVGDSDIGKSHAAKSLMMFLSTSLDATADLTGKPSLSGLQGRAVWSRHGICLWDDFRVDDARDDPELQKNTTALIQAHQSGVDAAKSNKDRGIAKSRLVRSWGILTSEQVVGGGAGIANRMLITQVVEGDVLIEPMGDAPLDHFRKRYGRTGMARAFFASYLQWLAGKIADAGGLRSFEHEVKARRDATVKKLKTTRTTASAAKLLVGWDYVREFATEHGFEDKLPDEHTIAAMILRGANEATEAAGEANAMVRILQRAADKLASGRGYVAAEDNGAPRDWDYLGWRKEEGFEPRPAGAGAMQIGKVGTDDQWICLNSDALKQVAKEENIGTAWKALMGMARALDYVHPESFPSGDAKPNVDGFRTRPRGLYVRADWLIPGWEEREEGRRATKRVRNRQ